MVGLVGLLWDLPLFQCGLPDIFWNKKCAEYFGGCIPKNKCLVWCNWKPRLPKACGNFWSLLEPSRIRRLAGLLGRFDSPWRIPKAAVKGMANPCASWRPEKLPSRNIKERLTWLHATILGSLAKKNREIPWKFTRNLQVVSQISKNCPSKYQWNSDFPDKSKMFFPRFPVPRGYPTLATSGHSGLVTAVGKSAPTAWTSVGCERNVPMKKKINDLLWLLPSGYD